MRAEMIATVIESLIVKGMTFNWIWFFSTSWLMNCARIDALDQCWWQYDWLYALIPHLAEFTLTCTCWWEFICFFPPYISNNAVFNSSLVLVFILVFITVSVINVVFLPNFAPALPGPWLGNKLAFRNYPDSSHSFFSST